MAVHQKSSLFFLAFAITAILLPAAIPDSAFASKRTATPLPGKRTLQSSSAERESLSLVGDIVLKGDRVVISRRFAEEVKKKNEIVLSTVAVKAKMDAQGKLEGFQLFEIDRGSPVEKAGFRPLDIITAVNAIPARNLVEKRGSLESADRFLVTVLRRGREERLRIEVR
jgi:hypothetical protein